MQAGSSGSVSTFEGSSTKIRCTGEVDGIFFLLGVDQKGDVLRI